MKLPKWLPFTLVALLSEGSIACSCARPADPNFVPDHAKSIIVAIPNRAEVIERPNPSQDRVIATVVLLDVLKGPRPRILPVMKTVTQPVGVACETSIRLGSAYVFFLDDVNQQTVNASACMPHAIFRGLRSRQEEFCFDGHPFSERCSPRLLKMLRGASSANEKYGFGEYWLEENWNRISNKIERLKR